MTTLFALKKFSRIQDSALTQESFDDIQCFPECGGIGIFVGTVRNHHQGRAVKALKYTSYTPVSEKMIRQIEQDIEQKYGVSYVRVIHRIGALEIGEKAIIAIARMMLICIYHMVIKKESFNPTDYSELMDPHFNQHKVILNDKNVFAYLESQGYDTSSLVKCNDN